MALRNTLNKSLRRRLARALDRVTELERTESTLLREQATVTRSIAKKAAELEVVKAVLAAHIVAAEATGYDALAGVVRRQLGDRGIDLADELAYAALRSTPAGLPPVRRLTAEEARLSAELRRSEKARAALDEQCRGLQRVNEIQAQQLRSITEGRAA